jgi:hypothetical protein
MRPLVRYILVIGFDQVKILVIKILADLYVKTWLLIFIAKFPNQLGQTHVPGHLKVTWQLIFDLSKSREKNTSTTVIHHDGAHLNHRNYIL